MKVVIKLFAQYRDGRFSQKKMEFPEGTRIGSVIETVGLDLGRYPLGIMLLNGRHTGIETVLQEGDILSLFPKVGGG